MSLQGKVALVTGASGGIGQAVCQRLAAQGAHLAMQYCHGADRAEALLAKLVAVKKNHSNDNDNDNDKNTLPQHLTCRADMRNAQDIDNMVHQTVQTFQRLDILVNTAGVAIPHPPANDDVSFEQWQSAFQETLAVNLIGASNVSYCAMRQMKKQQQQQQQEGAGSSCCRIIHISSRGAFHGEPEYPAYGASKAGLNALTQSLAVALAPFNIACFAIAPGFCSTPMVADILLEQEENGGRTGEAIRQQSPFGRVATPEDVAFWVECLARPESSFASGTIIDVNGASHLRT